MQAKLLLSTAAVALMLTAPAAFAQSNPDKKPEAGKEQTQAKPALEHRRDEQNADQNKSATSNQKQSGAQPSQAQSDQPPKQQQQKSASEQRSPDQHKSDKSAQREMKERNAQKQSSERSVKDSNNQHKAATTKSRSTTGQSTSDQQKPQDAQKNATTDQSKSSPSAAQQNDTTRQNATSNNSSNSPTNASSATNNPNTATSRNTAQQNTTNVNAQLTPEKRTRISETISRTHDVAPPVRDLRVSINIGTRVPERVHLHRLPTEIVSIEPAYREYDYFTTEQDIVIVNPHTRQVVTMISRDASRARAEVGSSSQVSSMSSGGSAVSSSTSGAPPCQVMRREASGQIVPVNPADLSRSTTGSGSVDRNQLSVTVQAPNGQSMPPITLPEETGQIVVATDGGDCKVTIEPGAR
jgi:chemotaxis protein histidine kinase CheA